MMSLMQLYGFCIPKLIQFNASREKAWKSYEVLSSTGAYNLDPQVLLDKISCIAQLNKDGRDVK